MTREQIRLNAEKNKQAEIFCQSENDKVRSGKLGLKLVKNRKASLISFVARVAEERNTSNGNKGSWDSLLKHLKKFRPNDVLFEEVSADFLKGFKNYLGTTKQKNGRLLSTNSKAAYFTKLKAALRQAKKEGYISDNPADEVVGFRGEEGQREFLTQDEVKRVYAAECDMPSLKRAFIFSCLTGLRWSDIIKLHWSDIHFDTEDCYLRFRQQKTKGAETIFLGDDAQMILGEKGQPDDRVFPGLSYNSWHNIKLTQWMLRAGITKNITFHCARHTYAVLQLDQGTDIFTLSKLLGHKDLKTTLVYSKILDKNKKAVINKISLI